MIYIQKHIKMSANGASTNCRWKEVFFFFFNESFRVITIAKKKRASRRKRRRKKNGFHVCLLSLRLCASAPLILNGLTLSRIEWTIRRAVLYLVCGFLESSRFAFLVDERRDSPLFFEQLSQFMLWIVVATSSEWRSRIIMMDTWWYALGTVRIDSVDQKNQHTQTAIRAISHGNLLCDAVDAWS